MKTLLLTSFIAAAVAMPAMAQEAPRTFDGPYVGVQLGFNQDKAGARLDKTIVLDRRVSKNSVSTGLFAGYNFRVANSVVLSPEAGLTFNLNDSFDGRKGGAVYTLDPKRTFDLGLRAGVVAGQNTLIYVRGGYTNTRVGRIETLTGGAKLRSNQTVQGWNIGAGVEQALGGGFSTRAEYRFSKLDRNSGDWRRHQLLAGLAYNF